MCFVENFAKKCWKLHFFVNVRIFARCCFYFPLISLKLSIVAKRHRQTACCKKLHFFFRRICAEDGRMICFSANIILFLSKTVVKRTSNAQSESFNTCSVSVQFFLMIWHNLKSLFICVFSFRLFQQKLWMKGNFVQEHQNVTLLGI